MRRDGYFDEYLGWYCVDQGEIEGKIRKPSLDILLKVRTDGLWPVDEKYESYSEDDFFDVIEYLYTCVSEPVSGSYHNFSDCGMHWEIFDRAKGQNTYVQRVNEVIGLYCEPFELSDSGEVLRAAEEGFQSLFEANAPTSDPDIQTKLSGAVARYRRHGSSVDERRVAVRELADILEYLRPNLKIAIGRKDEDDLFNIANNFGIRHHNPSQKTGYDAALWLSWMFYFYLATIHLVLRKITENS
ncbi:hypothetical protein IC608_04495 [Devosia sp. PTR5]|uniref:Uncharacterized protein n=2 Tax=Devosia oryzisoli TaxID=2774138 RepID=A0A927FSQ5_9HYPH|nr:hypothetical protein [Devosia oryzisoli]